jgi:peptidoglycan/xylan/chitin deacetylase (PgdA/CDA1 family)
VNARRISIPVAALVAAQLLPALVGIPGAARLVPGAAGRGRPDHVAVTFDDGPHPDGTPAVLNLLMCFGVRATFFVAGEQLHRYPDLGRRIVGEGHEIAVHGWNHRPLPLRAPFAITRELADTCDLVYSITSAIPRWYRPPYGVATATALSAARSMGLRPVWWTRWGKDWAGGATAASISTAVIGRTARGGLHGGDTVLLHDSDRYGTPGSWHATAQALPGILTQISDIDCNAGTLTQHITTDSRPGLHHCGDHHRRAQRHAS